MYASGIIKYNNVIIFIYFQQQQNNKNFNWLFCLGCLHSPLIMFMIAPETRVWHVIIEITW